MNIDVEQLIEEVSARPQIWDCNCAEYQIRKERINAWDEVCSVLFEEFDNSPAEKKSELCRILQRKWKSLRDCYVREQHRSKLKKGRLYRRKYVFYQALSFLSPTVKGRSRSKVKEDKDPLHDDTTEIEQTHSQVFKDESSETAQGPTNSNGRLNIPKKNKNQFIQETTSKDQSNTVKEDDEDRLFLLSLLKDLKKVPEDNKLEAKSELLLVLSKWKKSTVEAWSIEQIIDEN